ncbi:DoxX family protein [Agrobacterium sp. ATCC 31749]|nr:DoxX family protein [Agrobacterium sp. ATCC 31749]
MTEQGRDTGESQQYHTCFSGPYSEYQGGGAEDFDQNHKVYDKPGKRHALCGQGRRKAGNFKEFADTGLQEEGAHGKARQEYYHIIYLGSHGRFLVNIISSYQRILASPRTFEIDD